MTALLVILGLALLAIPPLTMKWWGTDMRMALTVHHQIVGTNVVKAELI